MAGASILGTNEPVPLGDSPEVVMPFGWFVSKAVRRRGRVNQPTPQKKNNSSFREELRKLYKSWDDLQARLDDQKGWREYVATHPEDRHGYGFVPRGQGSPQTASTRIANKPRTPAPPTTGADGMDFEAGETPDDTSTVERKAPVTVSKNPHDVYLDNLTHKLVRRSSVGLPPDLADDTTDEGADGAPFGRAFRR